MLHFSVWNSFIHVQHSMKHYEGTIFTISSKVNIHFLYLPGLSSSKILSNFSENFKYNFKKCESISKHSFKISPLLSLFLWWSCKKKKKKKEEEIIPLAYALICKVDTPVLEEVFFICGINNGNKNNYYVCRFWNSTYDFLRK